MTSETFRASGSARVRTMCSVAFVLAVLGGHTGAAGQSHAVAEAAAGDDYASAVAEARTVIRAIMAEAGIPGASVAVGVGDAIVWSEGFGWANLEQRVPVTTLTKFRVGSVSKTFTATGLGLLVERGRLDIDATVQRYVPDFPTKRWPFTIRQLGGHLAGIRHYADDSEMTSARRYPTVTSGLEIFQDDTLLFEPGTRYSYSSYGWNLLSAAMEGASGTEFLTFMRDEVFEPLGLRHTIADHTDSIIAERTSFYQFAEDGGVVNAPYADNSYKWAGGGFLSTPEDLVRFGQAHLEPGFLGPRTLGLLQTSQTLSNGEETGYGIGWRVGDDPHGHRTVGHSGGSVGGTTLLVLIPELELVVAGVVNIDGPSGRIVDDVTRIFERHLAGGR